MNRRGRVCDQRVGSPYASQPATCFPKKPRISRSRFKLVAKDKRPLTTQLSSKVASHMYYSGWSDIESCRTWCWWWIVGHRFFVIHRVQQEQEKFVGVLLLGFAGHGVDVGEHATLFRVTWSSLPGKVVSCGTACLLAKSSLPWPTGLG